MKIKSEQEMFEFGIKFAQQMGPAALSSPVLAELRAGVPLQARHPSVIELIGDVGVGKTTFVRGLAKGLGIKEPVTSPSFTISKSYACPDGRQLIHYDFYRLGDPGLMAEDLQESLSEPKNIVVIEWSDSVKELLPEKHTIINIKYNNDGSRELEVK
ncbi:MAG: tRNA (adenosine(37)-N6)-threonylcarbamoyltransferase complex ATPase subunit type 1 TsaE [Candidatus Saccharibacteria bacterium]|nr:tRNA (adenosine(37)-N6)-threonylcarbamoyltransferase complex ATPase subunit type 1 TsaE [Candidatus Saccharibacteria bacterium]